MTDRHPRITHTGEQFSSPAGDLEYAPVDPPEPGHAVTIAEGVLWARLPLPMGPTHINVWLVDDADGWTLIDTGMALDPSREAWLSLDVHALGGRPIRRIFVTHDHPDHMGLARSLQERHGAELWMSEPSHASVCQMLASDPEALRARTVAFMRLHGVQVPEDAGKGQAPRPSAWFDGAPRLDRAVADGDRLATRGRDWQAIETGGHCRGHLCLHDAAGRVLVSGDQVLPTISPNVSVVSSRPDGDPLGEFLASLDRLGACAADTLVLPSHGRPFRGLRRRLADVRAHHEQQLGELEAACREPRTAFELLPVMFGRPLRGMHLVLGMGEAVAHLNRLWATGRLERRQRDDGTLAFVVAWRPVQNS